MPVKYFCCKLNHKPATLRNFTLFSVLAMLFNSCGTTNNIATGNFSKKDSYKINSYAGCCGCFAKYFNIYSGKKLIEQIVYSYNCYNAGSPTKFIFNYNEIGHLQYCDKLVATVNDDFQIPVTAYEKIIFVLLDSFINLNRYTPVQTYTGIKGFRKLIDKEITHTFPLGKHSSIVIR